MKDLKKTNDNGTSSTSSPNCLAYWSLMYNSSLGIKTKDFAWLDAQAKKKMWLHDSGQLRTGDSHGCLVEIWSQISFQGFCTNIWPG